MTKDEALRLALEALEQWNTPLYKRGTVINAIKEALETKDEPKCVAIIEVFEKDWQLDYISLPVGKHNLYAQQYTYTTTPQPKQEQDEPVAVRYDFDGYGYKYIDNGSGSDWRTRIKDAEPLYTTPQLQTKDEPVAWMTINAYGDEDDIWYENPEGKLLEGWTYKPLYTTPQRTWVGLTDDDQIPWDGVDAKSFARAIEAKLKERNT